MIDPTAYVPAEARDQLLGGCEDSISATRGVLLGVLVGGTMWLAIGAALWLVLR